MILHGLLGSADNWQTLGRDAKHFTVHLVDARNHKEVHTQVSIHIH